MRIAFVTAVFPPTRGGMCTAAGAEARELAAAHPNDFTIFTLATGTSRADLVADRSIGAPVVRLHGIPRISLGGFVPQLLWKLRKFDVVYAQLPAYGFMEVLLLWKIFSRKRLAVTVHMDPVGVGFFKQLFKIERHIFRALIKRADAVRVSTTRFADDQLFAGVAREKIQVIPFGVDLKRFHPSTANPPKPIFLFVGRLSHTHYFKGVELLLRAFQSVAQKNLDAELWIVGDGDERKNYEHTAEKLRILKHVRFLGAVSDDELPEIYRQATVMVLPSIDTSETFGLVLLEAQASSVPVIASRLPGVDSVVADGVTGLLIEPGDEHALAHALIDVASHPDVWRSRRDAARAAAEAYGDWTDIAARVATLLY